MFVDLIKLYENLYPKFLYFFQSYTWIMLNKIHFPLYIFVCCGIICIFLYGSVYIVSTIIIIKIHLVRLTQSMFFRISCSNSFNNLRFRLSMRVGSVQNQAEPRAWCKAFEHKDGRLSTQISSNWTILQVPYFHDVILRKDAVLSGIMVVSLGWVHVSIRISTTTSTISVHDSEEWLIRNWWWLPVWATLYMNERGCLIDHGAILQRKWFHCVDGRPHRNKTIKEKANNHHFHHTDYYLILYFTLMFFLRSSFFVAVVVLLLWLNNEK